MRDQFDAENLIDFHLGKLDEPEAASVRVAIDATHELAARSRRCERLLHELDAYAAPPVAADLTERILARIAESKELIPFPVPETASALPYGTEREFSGNPVLSLRELITIAACITLFVGIFVPGYYKAQAVSKQNLCRSGMQQVYAGLYAYQEENARHFPYAGATTGGSWLRTRTPGVVRTSNTRHVYLLLREGHVSNPRVFVCPAIASGVPMVMQNYRKMHDFAEPANFTYSIQNNNVAEPPSVEKLPPGMVYMADCSPYFSGHAGYVLDPCAAQNSSSHEANAGQNVLYVDGHGGWVNRPTVGVADDDIYLSGTLRRYVGTELPASPTDSFLVP